MPASQVTAWAKVNLYLHVLGRRADGYHCLDSLVVFARFGDRLTFEPASDLSLTLGGPYAPGLSAGPENLVIEAAARLAARFGIRPQAHIHLEKRLPVAAGLGGGSADAAAALIGLTRLWSLPALASDLFEVAQGLGADVPVCLRSQPSFMSGIGERLLAAPALPPAWLVLANPGQPLSTPQVFAGRRGPFSAEAAWREPLGDTVSLARCLITRQNDLEAPARRLLPAIDAVLAALRQSEACLLARMSGSGASCFGLFAGRDAAQAAAVRLAAAQPEWWVQSAAMGAETDPAER